MSCIGKIDERAAVPVRHPIIGQTIGNAIAGNVEQSQEQQAQQDAAVPAWRDPNLIHLASDAVYDNGQPVGTLGGNSQSNVSDAAAFADIGQIEVSGSAAIADRLTPPNPNGGGWTVGWEQEDFSTNPSTAQTTLVSALGASGYLDSTNAQLAAAAFTAAGTSSNVNFSGIVDAQGDPVDLGTINDALATTAGAASVYNSSYNNYTGKFDALMTNITQDDNVLTSVHSALSDQTYGPMLKLVIADYNNQIGMNPNSATGMMGLLTTGSATSNGGTVTTLDESSPQSIVSSVMQYYLNSQYASNYGADVTRRLTDDVQATITAENNAGVTPPSLPITVTSTNGTAKISLSPNGTSYRGTWKPSN